MTVTQFNRLLLQSNRRHNTPRSANTSRVAAVGDAAPSSGRIGVAGAAAAGAGTTGANAAKRSEPGRASERGGSGGAPMLLGIGAGIRGRGGGCGESSAATLPGSATDAAASDGGAARGGPKNDAGGASDAGCSRSSSSGPDAWKLGAGSSCGGGSGGGGSCGPSATASSSKNEIKGATLGGGAGAASGSAGSGLRGGSGGGGACAGSGGGRSLSAAAPQALGGQVVPARTNAPLYLRRMNASSSGGRRPSICCGEGRAKPGGNAASQCAFATALPVAAMNAACAGVHASSVRERTMLTWTPRPRCTPAHCWQRKTPHETDAHPAGVSAQSAQQRLAPARVARSSTARAAAAASGVRPLLSPAARGRGGASTLLSRAGRRSSYVGRAGTLALDTALRRARRMRKRAPGAAALEHTQT